MQAKTCFLNMYQRPDGSPFVMYYRSSREIAQWEADCAKQNVWNMGANRRVAMLTVTPKENRA